MTITKKYEAKKSRSTESMFAYIPAEPQAPFDLTFHVKNEDGMHTYLGNYKLVESIEELKSIRDSYKGMLIAVDTETTGLTYFKDQIVGFSLAISDSVEDKAYYVPIRHKIKQEYSSDRVAKLDGEGNPIYSAAGRLSMHTVKTYIYNDSSHNLPAKEALDILYDIMINAKGNLLHNAEFDLVMLQNEGYDTKKIKFFDTLVLSYLIDPEAKRFAGLKQGERYYLGRFRPDFEETLGGADNFQYTDPADSYFYACHDKETEVLTENGWVLWENYDCISKLATVNMCTGELEYQSPTKNYKYVYNGKMIYYKNQSLDFSVTPNHSMVVRPSQNKSKPWVLKRAEDLGVEEIAMTAPVYKRGDISNFEFGCGEVTTTDLARLLGIIMSDGWLKKRSKNSRGYCINVPLYKDTWKKPLEDLLTRLPFGFRPYKHRDGHTWMCFNKELWTMLEPYAGRGARNKTIPPIVRQMCSEDIKEFLLFFRYGDGNIRGNNCESYYTTSKDMYNDLQELLILSGKRSSTYVSKIKKDCVIEGRLIPKENMVHVYTLLTTNEKTKRYKINNRSFVDYNDYVYCAEVPNHTLITRRNGKTLVSGNCVDAQSTYGLYKKLKPKVYQILDSYKDTIIMSGEKYDVIKQDNRLIKAFVEYYGHATITVNKQEAIDYKENIIKDLVSLRTAIYEYFEKGTFNLSTSSTEFKRAMESKNIITGLLTEKGAISYGKKGLKEFARNLKNLELYIKGAEHIVYEDGMIDIRSGGDISFYLAKILDTYGTDYFKGKYLVNSYRVLDIHGNRLDKKGFIEVLKLMYDREKQKFDILKKIQKNSSLNKAVNSYIDKLTQVDECKMRYKLFNTKSGRLASGNGSKSDKKEKNRYYIDLNAQNLSKPGSCFYRAYKSEREGNILGWKFARVNEEYARKYMETDYIVEGSDPKYNIRKCLIAPNAEQSKDGKPKIVMSKDYSNQESKIAALLSGDSLMINNFLEGIDPHTATAYGIWGKDKYNKERRKLAKTVNFAVQYGGGYGTISEQAEISLDEAKDILNKYEAAFWQSIEWKKKEISKMYKNKGIVHTRFGRPRRLGSYIAIAERNKSLDDSFEMFRKCEGFIKSAERRVTSHLIQGLCGDICRLVLIKLYEKYFKNKTPDIEFMNVVHDEINYYITNEKEIILKYARELDDLMTFTLPGAPFDVDTGLELGFSYGLTFPFTYTDESRSELAPKRSK